VRTQKEFTPVKIIIPPIVVKIPWPRALKHNELLVIEMKSQETDWRWRMHGQSAYFKGCEHDAHGNATVLQKQNPENQYRLKIYRRIK